MKISAFLLIIASLFVGCSTAQKQQVRDNITNTDVTGSVTYSGATVTIGRVNGRNNVNVAVDAKEFKLPEKN